MFDFIKRSFIMRIIKQIDSAGAKKYPIGWIKVRRAAAGWKLVIGYLVFVTPDILLWAEGTLPGLLPAVGVEDAAPIVRGIGTVLMAVGAIHKFLKFLQPIDRRVNLRRAAMVERLSVTQEVNREIRRKTRDGVLAPSLLTEGDINHEVSRRLNAKKTVSFLDGLP